MASKNLGAVIQRAISDGAFRRQLQSDPAAALRGFNLTAAEIAAIRSGDSSKLMSLGVDQRMSKAFSVGTLGTGGAARSTVSDLAAGGTASTIANDPTAGTREGIVGDPTSGARQAVDIGAADGSRSALAAGTTDTRDALTTRQGSGTRAVPDSAPFDSRAGLSDPTMSGTRSIHESEPFDSRGAVSTGDFAGNTRAVNDSEPFAGNAVINDNQAAMNAGRGGSLTGDMSGSAAAAAQDPYSGQYEGVSPDFQAGTVASRMADAGTAEPIRGVNDVAPFDSGINTVAGSEVIPTDELRTMEHST